MTNPGRWISHQSHATILILRKLHTEGVTRWADVCAATGRTEVQLRSLLKRVTGRTTWPAEISDELLRLPTRTGRGGGARFVHCPNIDEIKFDDRLLAERISRDQAAIRDRQLRWLEVERETYRLSKRARPIWEMPA